MSKRSYGFGIIGCGMISRFHAQAIAEMNGGHLECVFDTIPESASRFADEVNCVAYSDLKKFLKHPGLDIVTIATPSGSHMKPVIAAANAGKHIICEKPLEIKLERIDKMIAACRKNKVVLAGVFQRRFFEASMKAKAAIDKGRLGKMQMADSYVKWFRTQEYYDSGAWRGTWEMDGGGALMNQSIHGVDLLLHLAGDVKSVCAYAGTKNHKRIKVEDIAVAILKFKNGAMGVMEGSTNCFSNDGHPLEVQLCGSDGSIFIKDDKLSAWDFRKKFKADEQIMKDLGAKAGAVAVGATDPTAIDYVPHKLNFEAAVKAIRAGKNPAIDGKEARKSVELILAIYKSAASGGKEVELPLKKSPTIKKF
jgi:UDP-N-acetyl-2-amino-2-deoxyglucuronate dehydrogenase